MLKDNCDEYEAMYLSESKKILETRPDLPTVKPFGFPMNEKTRPLLLSQIERAIRERSLPWLPKLLLDECLTFSLQDTLPSPRALEGCNDDCVFAAAIALDLHRLRGHHPESDGPLPGSRAQPGSPGGWEAKPKGIRQGAKAPAVP